MRLADKVALVTGSARGIGRATVEKLAAEGASVTVADINGDLAAQTAADLRRQGKDAAAVVVDVTDSQSVSAAVDQVIRHFGRIDILVNNAGWDKVEPFLRSEESTWDKVIAINLYGTLRMCKAVLPGMIQRGSGKIVNVASDAGRVGSSGEAVYSAAKGGIIAFSKTLARELARYQINVNTVCPGPTDTPLFAEIGSYNAGIAEALVKAIPFRRLAQPSDLANTIAFLASDEASYITGQAISVNGGLSMC